MARQWMGPDGAVIDEDGAKEYMTPTGVVIGEDQAAAGGATRRYSLSLSGVGSFLFAALAGLTQLWDKISG